MFDPGTAYGADLRSALQTLVALLAILNPIGAMPIFITITSDEDVAQRLATVRLAARTVAAVLLAAAFLGEYVLRLFGINIAAFQVGGGILILLLALNMLQAKTSRLRHTPEETAEGMQKEVVGVVPLAIPLLAGPGAISTVILAHHQRDNWFADLLLAVDILIVATVAYGALRLAVPLSRRLGVTGINVATRIFGLILAAIAVKFISDGLLILLPGLGRA